MESPEGSGGAPRLGWGPEWVAAAVLALSLLAAGLQERDAPLLGPARREVVRAQTTGAVGAFARRVQLPAPTNLRDGPGTAFGAVARLDADALVYAFGDRDGWIRVTAVGSEGEPVQGWLRASEGGLAGDEREPEDASPELRRALAAGIELDFLDRYPPVTVRAVGDRATTLRVTAGQVRPRLAHRMGREIHWPSLAAAGFREFEVTDGTQSQVWRIPPGEPEVPTGAR